MSDISEISLKVMRESHVAEVCRLAQDANLSFWSDEDYRQEILRKDSVCTVAENLYGEVVGFLAARLIKSENYAELYNIAVKTNYRRQGIGIKLLNSLSKQCVFNKIDKILLEVRESNSEAINLYTKMNFKVVEINKNFYNNPPENALTMILDLSKTKS